MSDTSPELLEQKLSPETAAFNRIGTIKQALQVMEAAGRAMGIEFGEILVKTPAPTETPTQSALTQTLEQENGVDKTVNVLAADAKFDAHVPQFEEAKPANQKTKIIADAMAAVEAAFEK